MGVVTALRGAVWWGLMAHHSSCFITCSVISSCSSPPLWVLGSVHCLVSLALGWVRFWPAVSPTPVRCGVCSLGCLRGWSSFSLCLSFTCSCGGVVWSQVCGPSCCSRVLGYCGISVAPFCRLGLLRALPCWVFACGFLWFRGPSSWGFLGLFTGVLSSHFQLLRIARGSCCLHFVRGPLPMAGAVFFGVH